MKLGSNVLKFLSVCLLCTMGTCAFAANNPLAAVENMQNTLDTDKGEMYRRKAFKVQLDNVDSIKEKIALIKVGLQNLLDDARSNKAKFFTGMPVKTAELIQELSELQTKSNELTSDFLSSVVTKMKTVKSIVKTNQETFVKHKRTVANLRGEITKLNETTLQLTMQVSALESKVAAQKIQLKNKQDAIKLKQQELNDLAVQKRQMETRSALERDQFLAALHEKEQQVAELNRMLAEQQALSDKQQQQIFDLKEYKEKSERLEAALSEQTAKVNALENDKTRMISELEVLSNEAKTLGNTNKELVERMYRMQTDMDAKDAEILAKQSLLEIAVNESTQLKSNVASLTEDLAMVEDQLTAKDAAYSALNARFSKMKKDSRPSSPVSVAE